MGKDKDESAVKDVLRGALKSAATAAILALGSAVLGFLGAFWDGLGEFGQAMCWGGAAILLAQAFLVAVLAYRRGRESIVLEDESRSANRLREGREPCTQPVRSAYAYVDRICRVREKEAGPKGLIADLIRGEILPLCDQAMVRLEAKLGEPGPTLLSDRDELFRLFGNVMYGVYPKLTRIIRVEISCLIGFEEVFLSPEYAELQRLDAVMQDEMRRLWENHDTRAVAGNWKMGALKGLLDMPSSLAKPSIDRPPSTASEQSPPP